MGWVIHMAFDGVFIHFLLDELRPQLLNKRIQKIISVNETDFVMVIHSQLKLLISLNNNHPHLRFTELDYLASFSSSFFKKHLERGVIRSITQYHNDRIVTFQVDNTDELGYGKTYFFVIELTGKSCNWIVTDEHRIILACLKKTYLEDERLIQVKAPYVYPESNKSNPFDYPPYGPDLEGVSTMLMQEMRNEGSIQAVLNRPISPVLMVSDKKTAFYAFDIHHIPGERIQFDHLSALLEHYYTQRIQISLQNSEQKRLVTYLQKEIQKLTSKLAKQENELLQAKENLNLEKTANLLATHLHEVERYQQTLHVKDENEQLISIALNPKWSPSTNLNHYYARFKKAKRTISILQDTILETKQVIEYYECLLQQQDQSTIQDLKEILAEVGLKKVEKTTFKPHNLTLHTTTGHTILVGKNNIQNNYVTHTLAKSNDVFFHVKNRPGSHVILKGDIDDPSILLAAHVAAFYSHIQGKVDIDYTLVKWVKKVKGQKGSFVTYTHQKTITIEADPTYIDRYLQK